MLKGAEERIPRGENGARNPDEEAEMAKDWGEGWLLLRWSFK